MQHLDLNLLKVFESLYQERNMTRTAQVLNITPSAVSHAVKRLRETLNDPLFIRQGSQMAPTPACRRAAPQLINHLHQLRHTLQQFAEFDPHSTEQTFQIAIHNALEPLFGPMIYSAMAQAAPNAKLLLMSLDRQQVKRQMAAGQVDFAFDVAQPLGSPFQHIRLFDDPLCVLASKHWHHNQQNKEDGQDRVISDEKGAEKGDESGDESGDEKSAGKASQQENQYQNQSQQTATGTLSKAVYLAAQHIAVSNRPTGTVMEDFELQQQGYVRHIALRCQTYLSAIQIAESSDLLLTLPRSLAHYYITDELRLLPLPFDTANVETHLYWHENAQHDASLKWLKAQLLNLAIQP